MLFRKFVIRNFQLLERQSKASVWHQLIRQLFIESEQRTVKRCPSPSQPTYRLVLWWEFLVVQNVTILTALLLSPYYILTCNTLQSSRPTLLSAPVLLTVKQPRPFEINSSQCADKQVYLIHPTKQPTIRTQINLTSCYMQISTGAVHKPDRPTPFRLHVQAYNSRTSSSPITSLLVYLQKQSILLVLLFSFDAYCYRASSTMILLLVTSGRLVGCLFLKIYLVRNRRRRLQACCQCF